MCGVLQCVYGVCVMYVWCDFCGTSAVSFWYICGVCYVTYAYVIYAVYAVCTIL